MKGMIWLFKKKGMIWLSDSTKTGKAMLNGVQYNPVDELSSQRNKHFNTRED